MKKIIFIYHRMNGFTVIVYSVIFLFIILQACTERIDIKTDEEFQKLAVEGFITPHSDLQFVKLTKTSGYFSQLPPEPVRDAIVVVSNGENEYLWDESSDEAGIYYPPNDFEVILESSYELTIDLKDEIAGESHFESLTEMARFGAIVDSIHVLWMEDFESWVIQLYAYEPSGPDYYMFNTLRNNTLITDSLSRITVSDDRLIDGMYIPGIYTAFFYEDEMAVGDTIALVTSTITEDYYRFLIEAQTELFPKVPIFSGPPANVRSNIGNEGIGYFSSFMSDTTSYIIKETDITN